MIINQDTANMFACCYDNKEGHLHAHSAEAAIFPYVRVETYFASLFSGEGTEIVLSTCFCRLACLGGTGKVSQLHYHNIRQTCGTRPCLSSYSSTRFVLSHCCHAAIDTLPGNLWSVVTRSREIVIKETLLISVGVFDFPTTLKELSHSI